MTKIGDAYRWFHGRIAQRPTNFSWVIDDKLAGSGLPVTEEEFEWLAQRGVKSIVTVREEPLPSKWFNGSDIQYMHLYVEDFGAPQVEELDNAVNFIDRQISEGRPVMVHCAAGRGRTGTVLAAYLVKKENLTAQQSIEKIRLLRPGSIQSIAQETAVTMYEKYLKSKR
ncbi:MAG: dual specificity protein phosphatase 23 [Nitrososphaera sp.]